MKKYNLKQKKNTRTTSFYSPEKKTSRGLSSFWRGPWSSGYFTRNDDPRILRYDGKEKKDVLADINSQLMAKHLRAIRSTCYLVFNRKSLNINWASEDMSYTDIQKGDIRLSPAPLLTTNETYADWTTDERLDVIHGLALHEAAHNQWTPYDAKLSCSVKGGDIFAELFNIMEDIYIEHEVTLDYPGFGGYFESKDDYYFTRETMDSRIEKLVESPMDSIGKIKRMKKSDEDYKEAVDEHMDMYLNMVNAMIPYMRNRDMDLSELRDKGGNWQRAAEILDTSQEIAEELRKPAITFSERLAVTQEIFLMLASFIYDIPKEELEKSSMNSMLGEMEKSGLLDKLQAMLRENGVDPSSGNINKRQPDEEESESHGSGASADKSVREDVISRTKESDVTSLIEADLREIQIEQFEEGSKGPYVEKVAVIDMKPLPYANIRYRELSKKVQNAERRLMNTLKFRAEDRIYKEREREHGRIDGSRLHNLKAFKSPDIFYKTIKAEAPKVHVGILVDESGSMRSGTSGWYDEGVRKMDTAVQTAIMMSNALSKTMGTTYEVWGHSGDCGAYRDVTSLDIECAGPIKGATFRGSLVMRYVDPKNGLNDLRVLGRIAGRGNNYDGPAIEVVGKHMAENAPSDRKVMFVICDGMPAGAGYGGHEGSQDVANRVKLLRKKYGVEVISIFVGDLGSAAKQMNIMYGKENDGWIHCKDAAALPKVVEKIAARLLRWEGA